jgi:5-methylcytosine-specific restriction endonuclease McrBC regulatory subunit McrC
LVRNVRLQESRSESLELSEVEADELKILGRKLASKKGRFGQELDDDSERSSIDVHRNANSDYSITVRNAVGTICVGELQLLIEPKIPLPHFVYLLEKSETVPARMSDERGVISHEDSFFEIVVRWFLLSCEKLLRVGLDRDYEAVEDDLAFARGSILTAQTARSFAAGRFRIRCQYDAFTEDASLNRVLKEAARLVLAAPALSPRLRRRGRVIFEELSSCGDLRHGDLQVRPDRRRHHYRDAHQLALTIISGGGISLSPGSRPVWTFLVPSPKLVELGLLGLLQNRLPEWHIDQRGKSLDSNRDRHLAPDLVFDGGYAVGDVKYKKTEKGDIERPDLNQITTFATGYGAVRAAVLTFGPPVVGEHVRVGNVDITAVLWNVDEINPELAATKLVEDVELWLVDKIDS